MKTGNYPFENSLINKTLVQRSRQLGWLVLIFAALVLLAWLSGSHYLVSVLLPAMGITPEPALAFIVCSSSFLLITATPINRNKTLIGLGLAVFVFFPALFLIINWWPWQQLFVTHPHFFSIPLSFNTAFCFLLFGVALLLFRQKIFNRLALFQYIALLVALQALFSIVEQLYRITSYPNFFVFVPIPIGAACCFLVLSIALLFSSPSKGVMHEWSSPYTGGTIARVLTPVVVVVPVLLGLLRLYAYWAGFYSNEFGAAILICSIIIVFVSVIWVNTVLLNKKDILRAKTGQALRASEERFRLFVSGIKDYAIYMTDTDGFVVSWNEGAAAIKGYSADEIIGRHISMFYNAEAVNEAEQNMRKAMENGRFESETWHRRRDGSFFWADTVFTAIYDEQQVLQGFAIVVRDITQRKKASEQFKSLLDAVPDGLLIINQQAEITLANNHAEAMFGYAEGSMTGSKLNKLIALPSGLPPTDIGMYLYRTYKATPVLELQAFNKSGNRFPAEICLAPIETENGNLLSVAIRDLTHRKVMEEQLRRFNVELAEQVRKKTAELTHIFDRLADGFMAFDKEANIIYVNKKTAELSKRNAEDIVGRNLWSEFPANARGVLEENFNRAIKNQEHVQFEMFSNYSKLWFDINMYPSPDGLSLFFRDITDTKTTTKALQESEEIRSLIMNSSLDAIVCYDVSGMITIWNQAADTMFSLGTRQPGKRSLSDIIPAFSPGKFFVNEPQHFNKITETKAQRRDGTVFPVEMAIIPAKEQDVEFFIAFIRDITQRKTSEENIKNSFEEIRRLASHLQNVREEERADIAREIHDQLGQMVTSLKMDMSWISKKIDSPDVALREKIKGCLQLLDSTVDTIRKIATALRPSILDDLGLIAAIDWQSHEFEKRAGIPTTFESDIDSFDFSPAMSIGLFRICQESLTNIGRYAEARKVHISLHRTPHAIMLTIEDNGKGFDAAAQKARKKTLGLLGMKERAQMMGGSLNIVSSPGMGTTVFAQVPV